MHDGLLPLFPLSVVLLPRNPLPLHIFEERYKEMIGLVLQDQAEFGVVLASGGGISAAGCTASIEKILKRYEDGRLDILTLGRRRFQIRSLDQEKEYLRGEVEFVDDEDASADASLQLQAIAAWRTLAGASAEAPDPGPELSFALARDIDEIEFRQALLTTRSETERLRQLVGFIPGYLERTGDSRRLKKLAGLNGHGKAGIEGA